MATSAAGSLQSFPQFLRRELMPRPGRAQSIGRMVLGCSVTVGLAMVFQIPLPAYMAYVVFLVSRDEAAGTLLTALGGALAATLAVALSILFYIFDASEPALRLALLVVSTCGGIFLTRTCSLGPIVFLAGFILVLSQTLIDDLPSSEILTHLLLWLWLVAAIPAAVTSLIDLWLGDNPVDLLRARAVRLVDELALLIEVPKTQSPFGIGEEILSIAELRKHAQMWDKTLQTRADRDGRLVELLAEAFQLAQALPPQTIPATRARLARSLKESTRDLGQSAPGPLADGRLSDCLDVSLEPVAFALACVLDDIHALVRQPESTTAASAKKKSGGLFVPDAFSNPAHIKFALKVTFAVVASYVTYTLLDWPGIRTAVTTCFFIALGSLGESMHKLVLRLGGAVVGGVLAGVCIVFVLPLMTDIGQLLALIAVVSAVCAWVATSGPRLSYAGMQMAFAFFLGVLQDYGPATDLTVLRDRVIGIFIGNIWMSIAFGIIWPVTSSTAARAAIAKALTAAARILKIRPETAGPDRYLAVQQLSEARRLAATSMFEWKFRSSIRADAVRDERVAEVASRLISAVFAVSRENDFDRDGGLAKEVRWLIDAGERLSSTAVAEKQSTVDSFTPIANRYSTNRARSLLRKEMADAAPDL